MDALLHHGRLCLGIFRKLTLYESSEQTSKRFVICNPKGEFILHGSDLVYCLERVATQKPHDDQADHDVSEHDIDQGLTTDEEYEGRDDHPHLNEFL